VCGAVPLHAGRKFEQCQFTEHQQLATRQWGHWSTALHYTPASLNRTKQIRIWPWGPSLKAMPPHHKRSAI
jgi:hypothetical protein